MIKTNNNILLYHEYLIAKLFIQGGYPISSILKLIDVDSNEWFFYNKLFFAFGSVIDSYLGKKTMGSNDRYQLKQIYLLIGLSNDNNVSYLINTYFTLEHQVLLENDVSLNNLTNLILENPYIDNFSNITYRCVFLGYSIINPNNYIVHNGLNIYSSGLIIYNNDGKNPKINFDELKMLSNYYITDNNIVLLLKKQPGKNNLDISLVYLKKVDIATFTVVSQEYVYYLNRQTKSKSAAALKVIDRTIKVNLNKDILILPSDYAFDQDYIYYKGKIICEYIDNFKQLDINSHYYGCNSMIYFNGKLLTKTILV